MCAIIESLDINVKTATEDIICFKFYKKHEDGKLESWYRFAKYELGKVYDDEIKFFSGEDIVTVKDGEKSLYKKWYSKKGIHSAKNLWECLKMLEEKATISSTDVIAVCKCIIPKDSKYVKASEDYNTDYSNLDCYVSEKIKIEKVLCELKSEDIQKKRKWNNAECVAW